MTSSTHVDTATPALVVPIAAPHGPDTECDMSSSAVPSWHINPVCHCQVQHQFPMFSIAWTDFHSAEFPTRLHLYHALARSLARGCDESSSVYTRRPGLPTEIIEIICHYADFRKPGLHVGWKKSLKNKTVYAPGSIAQRALICVSCPLTRSWFSKAAAIQVNTVSKDQGWCG